ncbi:centrosomal protein of 126 kDa [Gastrophryne carolinensis]
MTSRILFYGVFENVDEKRHFGTSLSKWEEMLNQRTKSYSSLPTQLEMDLEEERQVLLEEQRIIRQRAHKLSEETNRRRKALEEKRREEELKEQRFREEVLHQRKLKLQEATEKFQRAHLPPSQRKRTAYVVHKKPTPKLEEALRQIQTPLSSTFYYLPNHRSPSNTRTSDTPPAISSIGNSGWPNRQQAPQRLPFDKVFQERSDSDQIYFQHRLEEAQRLLEEQHLSNLQNFHQEVEQLARSESLSSVDSLEESLTSANEADTLRQALSDISPSVKSGNLYSGENNESSSGTGSSEYRLFLADSLPKQSSSVKNKEVRTTEADHMVTNNGTWNGSSLPHSSAAPEINHLMPVSTAEPKTGYTDMGFRENTAATVVFRPSRAWATPDPTPCEAVQSTVSPDNKDTGQWPGLSIKSTMTQPLATPIVIALPGNPAIPCQANADSKASKYVHDTHSMSSVPQTDGMISTYNSQVGRVKSDHSRFVESNSRENLSHRNPSPTNLVSKTDSGVIQEPNNPLNENSNGQDHTRPVVHTFHVKTKCNSPGNKLLKSILKKGSKYEKGHNRTLGIGRMLQLGEKSSGGIRDSVELTKEKENKKNKKLRWLDEMDKANNKDVLDTIRNLQVTQRPSLESSSTGNFMEHVVIPTPSLNDKVASSGGMLSSVYSTGYHFTKQAWLPPKGEEKNSVGHSHAARTPPKAKTRIVKRPKSAKAQSANAYRHRRVVIRPQSATEASKLAKTPTKVMVPHPPPRLASGNNNGEMFPEAKSQSLNTNTSQGNHSKGAAPSPGYTVTRDTMPSRTISRSTGNLIAAQGPFVNDNSKNLLTLNSERVQALQESLPAAAKHYPIYGENGLRLDHTPTDEEISLLWQGVRSALSHKNSMGDLHPGDLPSNLQQTRPNLSHVLIDGGALSNWKSVTRVNGFSSAFVNGYVTLPRRRQILDKSENKRKALLDQRTDRPNSAGWRPPLTQIFHAAKMSPFPSAHEPAPAHGAPGSGEVSESTAQFMLAENLVETSATDGQILAAMQASKHNLQNHKSPNTGQTALSIEEQRLLQSLERLNQRLQNVQDTMKPLGATNGFSAKSTWSVPHIPPQMAETAAPSHKYRSLSADPRTRLQRRY